MWMKVRMKLRSFSFLSFPFFSFLFFYLPLSLLFAFTFVQMFLNASFSFVHWSCTCRADGDTDDKSVLRIMTLVGLTFRPIHTPFTCSVISFFFSLVFCSFVWLREFRIALQTNSSSPKLSVRPAQKPQRMKREENIENYDSLWHQTAKSLNEMFFFFSARKHYATEYLNNSFLSWFAAQFGDHFIPFSFILSFIPFHVCQTAIFKLNQLK